MINPLKINKNKNNKKNSLYLEKMSICQKRLGFGSSTNYVHQTHHIQDHESWQGTDSASHSTTLNTPWIKEKFYASLFNYKSTNFKLQTSKRRHN